MTRPCFFVRFTRSGSCLMDVQLKEGYMMMIVYLEMMADESRDYSVGGFKRLRDYMT